MQPLSRVAPPPYRRLEDYPRTAGGLTVYLGVMPAEIVKGQPPMHGGAPAGPHEHHIVVAIFDAASAARVSDATVTAKVSGLGLSGSEKTLEPMSIANTITYGGFFNLPGADLYTIRVSIRHPVLNSRSFSISNTIIGISKEEECNRPYRRAQETGSIRL